MTSLTICLYSGKRVYWVLRGGGYITHGDGTPAFPLDSANTKEVVCTSLELSERNLKLFFHVLEYISPEDIEV